MYEEEDPPPDYEEIKEASEHPFIHEFYSVDVDKPTLEMINLN